MDMKQRSMTLIAVAALSAGCASRPLHTETSTMTMPNSSERVAGQAPVNGISMYYEIHGPDSGTPLVLLHGGGSTIDSTYGRILPLFAQHRRVIAVEEQGHGRTTDRDAPIRFDTSADDVAVLLRQLKIEKADVMGFSNGASVAMELAIRHPDAVRKLVFASSMTKRSGAAPQFWQFIEKATFADMPESLKADFLAVNPDPKKLRTMHDKDLERMQHFVEIPDATVRSVRAPTLVVLGDRDVPTPEHAVELTRLLPHARLAVLPGGHGDYLGEVSAPKSHAAELTSRLIEQFLDATDAS
jgi:pimeloyl-ACP methyl ester carboxylesterase